MQKPEKDLLADSGARRMDSALVRKSSCRGHMRTLFKALGLIHPSLFQGEDADNVTATVALLPSGGENKEVMNGFWAGIQKKPFTDKCVRKGYVRPLILLLEFVGGSC